MKWPFQLTMTQLSWEKSEKNWKLRDLEEKLKNGPYAILLLNRDSENISTISLPLSEIGINGKVKLNGVHNLKKIEKVKNIISKK
jgi:hypothetical protein